MGKENLRVGEVRISRSGLSFDYVRAGELNVDQFALVKDPFAITAMERACMGHHFGPYFLDHTRGYGLVKAVLAGQVPAMTEEQLIALREAAAYMIDEGVARIAIEGPLMPRVSKFGGTSMLRVQEALAHIARNPECEAVMISITSPGGTAVGANELATAIRELRSKMPVAVHVSGYAFSGGYFAASQGGTVTAEETAEVGSIGCVVTLEDSSERYKKEGIKPVVIRSVPGKALLIEGEEISKEAIAMVQSKVDRYHDIFVKAVAAGRQIDEGKVREWATGETWFADDALKMGMIDGIATYTEALNSLKESIGRKTQNSSRKVVDTPRGSGAPLAHAQAGETMNLEKIKAFLKNDEQGQALLAELVGEEVKVKVDAGELVDAARISQDVAAEDGKLVPAEVVKKHIAILAKKGEEDVKLTEQVNEVVKLSGGTLKTEDVRNELAEVDGKIREERFARLKSGAEVLAIKNKVAPLDKTGEARLQEDFDKAAAKGLFGEIKDDAHRAKLFATFKARRQPADV